MKAYLGILLVLLSLTCVGRPPQAPQNLLQGPTVAHRLDALISRLVHSAPLQDPFRVEFRPIVRFPFMGMTWQEPRTGIWVIVIDSDYPEETVFDSMIHEWAHALRRHAGPRGYHPHDALWGVCYATAYRASRIDVPPEEETP